MKYTLTLLTALKLLASLDAFHTAEIHTDHTDDKNMTTPVMQRPGPGSNPVTGFMDKSCEKDNLYCRKYNCRG